MLFGIGGEVARGQELVDEILVLADAVAEHATMVTVGVNAPLHCDGISSIVCCHRSASPSICGPVIVYADAGIVAARTASAYRCSGEIRPGGNGLEDSAFRT